MQQQAQNMLLTQKISHSQIDGDTYDDAAPQIQTEVFRPTMTDTSDKEEKNIVDNSQTSLPIIVDVVKPFFVDITAPQNFSETILETPEQGEKGEVFVSETNKKSSKNVEIITAESIEKEIFSTPIPKNMAINEESVIKTQTKNLKLDENLKYKKTKPEEMLMPIFLTPRWPRL